MKYIFIIIVACYFFGCTDSNSVDSTLIELKKLDSYAAHSGDSTYIDSAYNLLQQNNLLEHFNTNENKYWIVLTILSKSNKWDEIIDLLEPYNDNLNDTLYTFKNYSKYKYFLLQGDEIEAKKHLRENLELLHNKITKENNSLFWISDITHYTYLIYGEDSARYYLQSVDSSYLRIGNVNKETAIKIMLNNLKERYEE